MLSAAEITRILDRTTNLKHWTIIAMFCATGLRRNELRNLKIGDIDSQRKVIHVREANREGQKGKRGSNLRKALPRRMCS